MLLVLALVLAATRRSDHRGACAVILHCVRLCAVRAVQLSVLTASPAFANMQDEATTALRIMLDGGFRHLIVTDRAGIVGIAGGAGGAGDRRGGAGGGGGGGGGGGERGGRGERRGGGGALVGVLDIARCLYDAIRKIEHLEAREEAREEAMGSIVSSAVGGRDFLGRASGGSTSPSAKFYPSTLSPGGEGGGN